MATSNAVTTPPIQQPFAHQPAAPARIGPGGPAVKPGIGPGIGNAAPPPGLPPAPFESSQTIQIPPDERAKAAVELFHAVRAELRALPANADPKRKGEQQQQLIAVQNWAIEFATANEKIQKESAEKAESQLAHAEENVVVATIDLDRSDPTSPDHAAKYRTLTKAQKVLRATENAAVLARRDRQEAESLLEQAKGTPWGDLEAADKNLITARDRVFAADMKLKAARNQPHLIGKAQIEFDRAAKQLADAEHERWLAEQAVPALRADSVIDIKK
jgi:hypothetical protein